MGIFTKEYKYKVIRDPRYGTVRVEPNDVDTAIYEYRQKTGKSGKTIDSAAKEFKKREHNRKVNIRRRKLKKFATRIGSGLKKTGKYLSETELAKQAREQKKSGNGWYRFEEKDDWF